MRQLRPLLLCSILMAGLSALGQNWNTDDLRWNVLNNFGENSERLLAETVLINDTAYRSMRYVYSCDTIYPGEPSLTGYVRQDEQQIYFRPVESNHEYLLYDFGLEAGDEVLLEVCAFHDQVTIDQFGSTQVQAVDSVFTQSAWHKRIRFPEFDWIEGLGSTRGPIDYAIDMCAFDVYLSLQCVREGDSLLYQDLDLPNCCFLPLSSAAENSLPVFFAGPNPVDINGAVQLFGATSNVDAAIYDSTGRLLSRWLWQQGMPFQPSALGLGAGLYLLHLNQGNDDHVQKLLVK